MVHPSMVQTLIKQLRAGAQTQVFIHGSSLFSVFLPKPPNSAVPNLSLQHQKPGGGLVGKRGLVCIAGYWGLSSLQEQMYLNIRKELHLQSPCCLHSEEKLIHDKVESGVWGAPLSSDR